MNKYSETSGIDISKDIFDCYGSKQGHLQFKNTEKGFVNFLQILKDRTLVVMEATGYYHYRLAQFLYKENQTVSVVNPLSVKRFIQMKLSKIKTDKSDSKLICEFGKQADLKLWFGDSKDQQECFQITRLLSVYSKQNAMLKNKIYGEEVLDIPSRTVFQSIKRYYKVRREIINVSKKRASRSVNSFGNNYRNR